uniref:Uncharacterized protein n=1 Tax=Pipistrellus kuhlii TaxID=59472 RepID=A0A7J7ZJQ3_PIPKU|nr:hypothetical protein mPipKuh1_009488 [Pipistrellus kuhlii]
MTFKVSAHPLNLGASVKISMPADGNLLFQWPGLCLVAVTIQENFNEKVFCLFVCVLFFFEEGEKWSVGVHIGKKISVIHTMLERSMFGCFLRVSLSLFCVQTQTSPSGLVFSPATTVMGNVF